MTAPLSLPADARRSAAFLAVGIAGIVVYRIVDSAWIETAITIALSLGAFLAVAAVVRRTGGRSPWVVVAASSVLWLAGWIPWQASILRTGAPPPSFSFADALFMPSYALLAIALLLFVRVREPSGGGLVETAMIATGAALASWLLLIEPALDSHVLVGEAGWGQALYALLDVLMLAALARALLGAPRGSAYILLLGSVGCLLAADSAWNWLALAGTYSAGGYYDLGWLAFSVLLGAAALHPSAACAEHATGVSRGTEWRRLTVLLAAGATLAAVAWLGVLSDVHTDTPAVAAATTLLAVLVLARAFMLLREGKRLSRALTAQNAELRQLDRLKDEFVASVSHELRTPLTSIRGYLELVREGEPRPTAEQDRFLGIVDRNAERLLHVVGDLLLVAQLTAGSLPLERRPLDPAELTRHAADSARPLAQERGVELAVELGPLPETLTGDGTRLAQALDNLVSNAVKFTPAGGTVALRAGTVNGSVELAVADTGPGISEHDQQRLFQRFFRTEHATTQAVPGTGLGLAITKAIVEAHGGTIGVSSELGRGTEFRIHLPAAA